MLPVRKALPPVAATSPWLTLVPDAAADADADAQALRGPVDTRDDVLHHRTIRWLATLPAGMRPTATGRLYPRIVNQIGNLWPHCEYTRLYFQSLLIDRRGNRKGFPPDVRVELEILQQYYFEHLSKLPALLWNAVPARPPRIPNRIFVPDAKEIDVLPL